MAANPVTGSIIVYPEVRSDFLYYIKDPEDPSSIETIDLANTPKLFARMCFADEVWLLSGGDLILSYDLETKILTSHTDLNFDLKKTDPIVDCYVTRDNRLLIIDKNRILFYNAGKWTSTLSPGDEGSLILYQDTKGILWALPWMKTNGKLYKIVNGEWIIVQEFDDVFENFMVASDGKVWLSNITGVYMWDSKDASSQVKVVVDEQNTIADFFEDANGNIWIITDHNLRIYKNNEIFMAKPPLTLGSRIRGILFDEWPIWGATFDFQHNRLFMIGWDSIWYADTNDIPILENAK